MLLLQYKFFRISCFVFSYFFRIIKFSTLHIYEIILFYSSFRQDNFLVNCRYKVFFILKTNLLNKYEDYSCTFASKCEIVKLYCFQSSIAVKRLDEAFMPRKRTYYHREVERAINFSRCAATRIRWKLVNSWAHSTPLTFRFRSTRDSSLAGISSRVPLATFLSGYRREKMSDVHSTSAARGRKRTVFLWPANRTANRSSAALSDAGY